MPCPRHPAGEEQPWCQDCYPEKRNPYHKHDGTEMPTEVESARAVAQDRGPDKPMPPHKLEHQALWEFKDGQPKTAYHVSLLVCGDAHGVRREVRRLFERGYVELLPYTLPNPAPRGRGAVEAWKITTAGMAALIEHGQPQPKGR